MDDEQIIFGVTYDETSEEFAERIIGIVEARMGIPQRETASSSLDQLANGEL